MPSSSSDKTSSANAESSSDSGNMEKISTRPSIKPYKKSSSNNTRNTMSTPSKPSSSMKRPREPVNKQSSKKSKKPAQEDNKGKAPEGSEAEKSAKRNGAIWNANDEAAFLKRLVAFYEQGKTLPKNLSAFYEAVKNDLDGDYSNDQLYNKARRLKLKFGAARDKIKNESFVGFKNSHEESLYRMSEQVWGNREEEEGCSEKVGKGDNLRGERTKNVAEDSARGEEKKKKNAFEDNSIGEEKNVAEDNARGEKKRKKKNVAEDNARGEKKKKKKNIAEDNARGEKKRKHVVDKEEDRKELKMNKSEDVGMALKEQEEEAGEDENEDAEEEEGHGEDEQNANVSLSQQDTLKEVNSKKRNENGPSHIAGTGTQKSEVAEKDVSSEEDVGEEQDSSEESENESTDNENSALPDSNVAVELSKSNIGNSSTPRNLKSALKQTTGREKSTNHVSNGMSKGSRRLCTAGHYDAGENSKQDVVERLSEGRKVAADAHHDAAENLAQPVSNNTANGNHGMTDQHQMFDQLCKENSRISQSQRKNMLDELKNEVLNIVDTLKNLQSSSNSRRASCFDFTRTRGFSFGKELPPLSKTEAEMIDRKWQTQQLIEMEAASKHFALLQEEYQLRMAK